MPIRQPTIQTVQLTGQTTFTIPFEYLMRKFVKLTLISSTERKELVLGTDYRFTTKTTVQMLSVIAPQFTKMEIRRVTSASEPVVSFIDGSVLRAGSLNAANTQTLHVAEEARDSVNIDGTGISPEGQLDARGRRIVNVAIGVEDSDAITLGQVKGYDASALNSAKRAEVILNDISKVLGGTPHRRKVAYELGLKFPDYEECRIKADNANYIYPQSMAIKDDAIYVLYSVVPSVAHTFVVKFSHNGTYLGYHHILVQAISEGLHIDGANVYVADRSGNIVRAVKPSVPNKDPITPASTHAVGVYGQFTFSKGKLYTEQRVPEVGLVTGRTSFAVHDATTFALERTFTMPLIDSGYILVDTTPLAPYFPKRQGFAIKDGYFIAFMGSYWGQGEQVGPYKYQGVKAMSTCGTVIAQSMLYPDKQLAMLRANGYDADRVESEGGCVYNNKVYELVITKSATQAGATSTGIIIWEVMSPDVDAIDFEDCEADVISYNADHYSIGTFPRSVAGYANPITGALFTSVQEIIEYMRDANQKVFNFYTSTVTGILDSAGVAYKGATYVSITNMNANTIYIKEVRGDTSKEYYAVFNSATGKHDNIVPIRHTLVASDITLHGIVGATSRQLGRVLGVAYGAVDKYVADADKVMAIDIQSAETSQPLFLGGGSSLYRSANAINFVTNPDVNAKGGTVRWSVDSAGQLSPFVDDTYNIGYANKRVSTVFSKNGVQTTSDARLKTALVDFTEAELKASCEIADKIGFWEWKDDGDRRHCGLTVQLVIDILAKHGLKPFDYSFICHDEWEAADEERNEEGDLLKPAVKAGDIYSFRDNELNRFLMRGTAYRLKRIEEALSK